MTVDAGLDDTGRDSSEWNANRENSGFAGNDPRARIASDLPDPRKLAEDWITLWQSELTAIAADPELRESWQAVMALWAATMSALLRGMPRGAAGHGFRHGSAATDRHDGAGGQARTADAPRTPPAAAAPDARDAEIERLARHVATLERRLAALERGHPPIHPKRGPGRRPRK
ncbi:MAG TPA: hypothetical protein VGM32_17010 [Rhodopila sp.]